MSESLIIKDGTGALSKLTVESGSYGLMPVHYVTSSNAHPVYITSSANNPLPITGNINVDVVVGDLINITSSHANPVAVTGTVSVNTISSNSNPVWITGSTAVTTSLNNPISVTGSVNIEGAVNVTSSAFNPLYVIGDINVTSSPAFPSYVTGDMLVTNLPLTQTVANDYYSPLTTWVTNVPEVYVTNSVAVYSSLMAPVYAYAIVTSSYLAPVIVSGAVNVVNNPLLPLSVSGSVSVANTAFNPLNVTGNVNITNIHLNSATGTIRSVFSTADSSIDFNDAVNYGAFAICLNNPIRKGLVIHNSSNEDLYLAISTEASTSYAGRNGFVVTASNAIPDSFSLILTAKQTHIADSSTVNLFYGGFFVSSSNYARVMATETY